MEKDDDEKEKPIFPPEYGHLEEPLKQAREQIKQIDHALKNLPRKKGPTLSYRPPGAPDDNRAFKPEKTIKRLNKQRDDISRNFETRVYKETKNADPKLASHLRGIVKHKLGKSEDRDKTPSELAAIKGEEKKVDRSFGYMESLQFSRFTHKKEVDVPETAKKQYTLDEMSDRFMNNLKAQRSKSKDKTEPVKGQSEKRQFSMDEMSERFMNNLEAQSSKSKDKTEPIKGQSEKTKFSMDEMSDRFMDKLKNQPEKAKTIESPSKDEHDLDME